MGEYFVFTTKDTVVQDKDDTTRKHQGTIAIQRKVTLGQTIAPNVIIKAGLKEDDKIVVDGVQSLHTGSEVKIGAKPERAIKGENGTPQKTDSMQSNAGKGEELKKPKY
jgi:membrane fusion protein (multidrug efflux system)